MSFEMDLEVKQHSFESGVWLSQRPNDTVLRLKHEGDLYEWHVDSELLCAKSSFFKTALTGDFKEAKDKTVELHDDRPEFLVRVLQHMYYDTYDGLPSLFSPFRFEKNTWFPSYHELICSGRQAGGSEELSHDDFKLKFDQITSDWKMGSGMWIIADKYDVGTLKDDTLCRLGAVMGMSPKFFLEVFKILAEYSHQDVELKTKLVETACRLGSEVLEDGNFHEWLYGDLEAMAIAFNCMRSTKKAVEEAHQETMSKLTKCRDELRDLHRQRRQEAEDLQKQCRQEVEDLKKQSQQVADLQRENASLKRSAEDGPATEAPASKRGRGRGRK